MLCGDVV